MRAKSLLTIAVVVALLAVCWYYIEPFAQQLNDINIKSAEQEATSLYP